jgi:hypothetical protein
MIEDKRFAPFRKLKSLAYPGRIGSGHWDFLWMICSTKEEWERMKRLMVARLTWSANDPEEFAQAAATQVAFDECGSFIRNVRDSKAASG